MHPASLQLTVMPLRGGFGELRAIIFEKPVDFGDVLRFEVGILAGGLEVCQDVFAGAVTKLGVFEVYVPFVVFFFHFVALILEAEFLVFAFLRLEAIFGFASFGS
jgi:hypothetical protein